MSTWHTRTESRDFVPQRKHRGKTIVACAAAVVAQCIAASPAVAGATSSWGLDRIDQRVPPLDGAYTPSGTGAGVTIWVLGTGLRYTHVDFGGRAQAVYDAVDGNGAADCNGLGTLMAGLAGGAEFGAANGTQLRGVAIADCAGDMQIPDVIDGLDYVAANASPFAVAVLPAIWCEPEVNAAIQNLIDAGVTVVVAAGDDGSDLCRAECTPLAVPDAIVVGAVDDSDCRASFSNYGPGVDIFAPGVDVTGPVDTSDTATVTSSGTALAASYVAGIAATYRTLEPGLTPAGMQDRLLSRSTPISGCGETMRLVYAGLDDHPVPPPPPPGPGENPCPEECPAAGTTTTKSFAVVGAGTGVAWEWAICSPTAAFPDVEGIYPGLTGTALDIANAFAGSVNAAGCSSISASAAPNFFPPGSAILTINVDDGFDLKVRTVGSPTWCTVITLGMCGFNPDIQEILLSGFDCQNNGVDDIVDILTGMSVDTNFDAIPDECQGLTSEAPLGIAVQALGDAIIGTTIDGAMTVSNIDSSGLNGVRIDLGQAQGWEGTFRGPMVAADLPTGTMFTDEVIGSVNGVPGQRIMTTTFEDMGPVLQVTPVIPGPGSYELKIFDGPKLVASVPGQTGPAYRVAAVEGGGAGGYFVWTDDQNVVHCYPPPSSSVVPIEIVSTAQVVNGDRIQIICEGTSEVQWMSEIRRRGRTVGAGQVTEIVERMAMQQFGQQHEASGVVIQGAANPVNPGASVLDIRSASGDGIVTGNIVVNSGRVTPSRLDVLTSPINLGAAGRSMTLRATGSLGGVPNSSLGVVDLRSNGSSYLDVSSNFAGLSPTARVEMYNENLFVGQVVLPGNGLLGQIRLPGSQWPPRCGGWGKNPGSFPCIIIPFPRDINDSSPIRFIPSAASGFAGSMAGAPIELVGDEIRVIANEPSAPVDYLQTLELEAVDFEEFTIVDEVTTDLTPDCPADLDGSGEVGFADLTALLNAWGPCGVTCDADLDGSGDVGFADLTALLNAWGPCA